MLLLYLIGNNNFFNSRVLKILKVVDKFEDVDITLTVIGHIMSHDACREEVCVCLWSSSSVMRYSVLPPVWV